MGMVWFLVITLLAFVYLRLTRARRLSRFQESQITGMARSPWYWAQTALLLMLLGLMFSAAHFRHGGPTAVLTLVAIGVVIIALLLVRRALKWRFPI